MTTNETKDTKDTSERARRGVMYEGQIHSACAAMRRSLDYVERDALEMVDVESAFDRGSARDRLIEHLRTIRQLVLMVEEDASTARKNM
ncbi:MAG: hypothetical protein IT373_20810 [Polyangiaceae bacterium]|nr:hypothetical protein [Polyangiaceae bacterium]